MRELNIPVELGKIEQAGYLIRISNFITTQRAVTANHGHLNYFAYNFIKTHRTLRTSPAMAVDAMDRLWEVSDLVALWEPYERDAERAAQILWERAVINGVAKPDMRKVWGRDRALHRSSRGILSLGPRANQRIPLTQMLPSVPLSNAARILALER